VPDDVKPIGKLPAAKQAGILQLVLRFYQALNAEAEPFMTTDTYNKSELCKLTARRSCIHFCRDCAEAKARQSIQKLHGHVLAWFRCVPGQKLTYRVGHDTGCVAHMILQSEGHPQ